MIDKIYLKKHMNHREELRNEQERYEIILNRSGPKSKQMDGMPHAASVSRDAGYINDTFDKIEIEKKIDKLKEVIKEEYEQINPLLENLEEPDEKSIMKMRYFHGMEWSDIREIKYSKRWDYFSNMDKYKDKVFKIHGSALKHIKEMQESDKKRKTMTCQ